MNPLRLIMTFLLLAGTAGCATYLYSAHVPVAAYSVATGLNTDTGGPGFENTEIRVASADPEAFQGNADEPLSNAEGAPAAESGQVFADMRTATGYFRDLLRAERVPDADDYVLTKIDKNDNSEFVLIAAVYRPSQLIEVSDERFPGTRNVITDKTPAFYAPYQTDTDGRPLDRVVAWSLVPVNCLNGPEQQAMVLKDTAESLKENAPKEDFWVARQQWVNGDAGVLMLAGNLLSCPAPASAQG